MMYNKLLEDCFFATKHVGRLDVGQDNTINVSSRIPGRGDAIELSLHCDTQGKITKSLFKAQGSPYMIAAMEWICRKLEGDKLVNHPKWDCSYLQKAFDMPDNMYPVTVRVIELYQSAIEQMTTKLNEV